MNSMIYDGFVSHQRHIPVSHRFAYPVYVYGLDLEELPRLDRRLPLFGYNRMRPAAVFDRDYLDSGPGTIREKLAGFLAGSVMEREIAAVRLITSARYFNYVFNPVSFYLCLDARDAICAMAAEVNNTFGERHVYIPEKVEAAGPSGHVRFAAEKAFHVSPFNDMAGRYEFSIAPINEALDIRIQLLREDAPAFEARLWGRGRPLTAKNHFRMLLSRPLRPHLTMPRIMFQAARLYFQKHLPYHAKPEPASPMTIRKRSKRR